MNELLTSMRLESAHYLCYLMITSRTHSRYAEQAHRAHSNIDINTISHAHSKPGPDRMRPNATHPVSQISQLTTTSPPRQDMICTYDNVHPYTRLKRDDTKQM